MTDPTESMPSEQPESQADGTTTIEGDAPVTTAATEREVQDARDRHLRLAAEYDHFRRRAAKERQEAGWRAQGELVRGLLDAIDDITRFAHVISIAN